MHIQDIFSAHKTTFSFEFMPPKSDEDSEKLYRSVTELEALYPSFVSVTYGAGGSTRERTRDLVVRIKDTTTLDPVPHLTCVCHSEADIEAILVRYAEHGISNIMALAGDPPRSMPDYDRSGDRFQHAVDLVAFIRRFNERGIHPDRRGFGIGVAGFPDGHPGSPNRLKEIDYLKAKVDAGADYIVTQLFFDNHAYYDFVERCELAGVTIPILAGIMPITSEDGLLRMADLAPCTNFPAGLLRSIRRANGDKEYVRKVGIQWTTEQCRLLLDHRVRGIHFYTLNRSRATRDIYANLGVRDSRGLVI